MKWKLVFRGDGRAPAEIFKSGFLARGTNYAIDNHLRGGPDSGFVSTTLSEIRAADFAYFASLAPADAWVYTIELLGGPNEVYIDANLFNIKEDEIAFRDCVPPDQIVSAQRWDWVTSPNGTGSYQPRTASDEHGCAMMTPTIKLLTASGDEIRAGLVAEIADSARHLCRLRLDHPTWGGESIEDRDFFQCLKRLRRSLEEHGVRVLCNGSRRDVIVTGMASDMGYGLKVYPFKNSIPIGEPSSLVPLFAEADRAAIATVEEQEMCQQAYWRSVGL